MDIQQLTEYIDDIVWADLRSVRFNEDGLELLINTKEGESERQFEIRCKAVHTFRLSDTAFDWIELASDGPELLAYSRSATTYVIWGDTVDWPHVVGRLTQEFAAIPDVMSPAHISETKRFTDYRLPVTIPEELDATFQTLLAELGINAYVHDRRDEAEQRQLLRLGDRSFIIAGAFEVIEVAT